MTEQLISYETAKLAKEKDFDWMVRADYENGNLNPSSRLEDWNNFHKELNIISAPTQALLQKWLRDEHGWHIILIPVVTMGYTFKIMKVWKKDFTVEGGLELETPPYKEVHAWDYRDYEEALENALVEVLKLL